MGIWDTNNAGTKPDSACSANYPTAGCGSWGTDVPSGSACFDSEVGTSACTCASANWPYNWANGPTCTTTPAPSWAPSSSPTFAPTLAPTTNAPTGSGSGVGSGTSAPTLAPTLAPTKYPTRTPPTHQPILQQLDTPEPPRRSNK